MEIFFFLWCVTSQVAIKSGIVILLILWELLKIIRGKSSWSDIVELLLAKLKCMRVIRNLKRSSYIATKNNGNNFAIHMSMKVVYN